MSLCPPEYQCGEGHGLTGDHTHTRLEDMLITGWDRGESCHQAGAAALAAEAHNLHSNGPKCQELGWSCIPLAVETYSDWGRECQDAVYVTFSLASPPPS
ncbi:hypothetical protein EMCRGX_G014316 [Ephydatia muelleri]